LTPLAVQQHIPPPIDPSTAHGQQPCAPPTGMLTGAGMSGQGAGVSHTGAGAEKIRARTAGAKAILFGDSQMGQALGAALSNYVKSLGYNIVKASSWSGSSDRMARGSSPVGAWLKSGSSKDPASAGKFGFIESALKEHNPEFVVICLGGNGCGGGDARKLVDKIRAISPNSRILWVGPPPAVRITDMAKGRKMWGSKIGNDPNYKKNQMFTHRANLATQIGGEIGSLPNVYYVNTPHQKVSGQYQNDPGPGCDGIHCNKKGAIEILNAVSSKSSMPPGGPVTPQTAQKKPKHQAAPPDVGGGAPHTSTHAKLATVYQKISQKWQNQEDATKFLQEKAEKIGETVDNLKNRDWISGYAISDGHVKAGSVSVAQWKPARLAEIADWGNFTSWPKTNTPATGPETMLQGRKLKDSATSSTDSNPIKDAAEATNLIKTISYDMAAAAHASGGGIVDSENPVTKSSNSNPSCPRPVGSVGPGGEAYSGNGAGNYPGGRGKYSQQEAASIAQRVNTCLQQQGVSNIEIAALMAFMEVESGFKKPHPGLVRFEPHVWYKRGGAQGIPYRAGKSKCDEGYKGKDCGTKTKVDYTSANTNRAAFDRAAKMDLRLAVISTSWGSFQVMGFNMGPIIDAAFGGSYDKFVQQFDSDPDELNVNMVCHFIAKRGNLQSALANKDWRSVSKIYNGSYGYAKRFEPAYARAKQSGVA